LALALLADPLSPTYPVPFVVEETTSARR